MNRKNIPIFFACDDNFVKFTIVSLLSIKEHASRHCDYTVYVLHAGITENMMRQLYELQDDNFTVIFRDVTDYLVSISDKLPIRDYYSKTTYYRVFIAEMYPDYDKAIYIDSDTVIRPRLRARLMQLSQATTAPQPPRFIQRSENQSWLPP